MLGFLKPSWAKAIGTVLLLVANAAIGFIGNVIGQIMMPKDIVQTAGPAFAEAMAGVGLMQVMIIGIVILVVDFVLKVIAYYVIVAFTVDRLAKPK